MGVRTFAPSLSRLRRPASIIAVVPIVTPIVAKAWSHSSCDENHNTTHKMYSLTKQQHLAITSHATHQSSFSPIECVRGMYKFGDTSVPIPTLADEFAVGWRVLHEEWVAGCKPGLVRGNSVTTVSLINTNFTTCQRSKLSSGFYLTQLHFRFNSSVSNHPPAAM